MNQGKIEAELNRLDGQDQPGSYDVARAILIAADTIIDAMWNIAENRQPTRDR